MAKASLAPCGSGGGRPAARAAGSGRHARSTDRSRARIWPVFGRSRPVQAPPRLRPLRGHPEPARKPNAWSRAARGVDRDPRPRPGRSCGLRGGPGAARREPLSRPGDPAAAWLAVARVGAPPTVRLRVLRWPAVAWVVGGWPTTVITAAPARMGVASPGRRSATTNRCEATGSGAGDQCSSTGNSFTKGAASALRPAAAAKRRSAVITGRSTAMASAR
jgi:hypothetical protein